MRTTTQPGSCSAQQSSEYSQLFLLLSVVAAAELWFVMLQSGVHFVPSYNQTSCKTGFVYQVTRCKKNPVLTASVKTMKRQPTSCY